MLSRLTGNDAQVLVLDGGLSTELERRGHDISGQLWSAQLLLDAPSAVVEAHRAFLDAGADIVTTASYQASPEGFARAGIDAETGTELIRRSVRLARQAVEESGRTAFVAGSVGPYGAMLADGSEYTGDYGAVTVDQLRAFHRPRLELLVEAGVDVLAVETIPSTAEVRALVAELDRLKHPAWLSLTTTSSPETGTLTRQGESAYPAFCLAAALPSIVAVGANCTDPAAMPGSLMLATSSTGKPGIAYPNSGEGWDAEHRTWTPGPASVRSLREDVAEWLTCGARIVGGCCRVGPDQIRVMAEVVQEHNARR